MKNQLFPKEKLVFLGKANFFLGKPKKPIFSAATIVPPNVGFVVFWFSLVFGQSNREGTSEENHYT